MKFRRTLNDKDALRGEALYDPSGGYYIFVEISGAKVPVIANTSQIALKGPEELRCYLLSETRTVHRVNKVRLGSFWED